MIKLTDQIRTDIITALLEGASYRESIDMQQFLKRGVTESEIGLIDTSIQLLHESPYLTDRDFENLGYSYKSVQRILGGISHFKSLLNLEEYTLQNWIVDNGLQYETPITLPYFIYQHFVDEIRTHHMSGLMLSSDFEVELGGHSARSIIFKCGTSLLLPKDATEMAAYIILSRFGRYKSMTFDSETNTLTAETEHCSLNVEVKIFASQLTQQTPISVCLIDDIPECDYCSRSSTKILKLGDFSMKHGNGANRELLKVMKL